MDTIHDLGGREGFGPVPGRDEDDSELFHEPWQARTWATCMMTMARLNRERTGYTLDWYRHVLERIMPADYLAMNYFNKWAQGMMATLVDQGVAEVREFVEGHARGGPARLAPAPPAASADPGEPKFSAGDKVATQRDIASMHTRLPGYVRGRKGVVDAYHGAEILPDASAKGDIRKEPLYTVRFEAAELWPDDEGQRAAIYVDLWESYLEPA